MERQRGFTLIELFLTIGLIAMVGGLLLFRAKPMLDRYRFDHGIAKLNRELLYSKHLSEAAHADVDFTIERVKGGLICIRNTDEPLKIPHTFKTKISIPHLQLVDKEKITICYTSSGYVLGDAQFSVKYGEDKSDYELSTREKKIKQLQ